MKERLYLNNKIEVRKSLYGYGFLDTETVSTYDFPQINFPLNPN